MEIPHWKTPFRKIPTHHTQPLGECPAENSNKIPTSNISAHVIN